MNTIGPFGLGFKAVPLPDATPKGKAVEGVVVSASPSIPLTMLRSDFTLPVRDIAAAEQSGLPLDLAPAVKAALAVARQEDSMVFNGFAGTGLLNTPGSRTVKLKLWKEVGSAVDDVIIAVTELDGAGFHGPYALALSPTSYNLLFRRYAQGNQTELEHLRQIVTDGIVKAPGLDSGGVLVDTSCSFANIVLGQDLVTSFVGPGAGEYQFSVLETVALWVRVPQAVCVLK